MEAHIVNVCNRVRICGMVVDIGADLWYGCSHWCGSVVWLLTLVRICGMVVHIGADLC